MQTNHKVERLKEVFINGNITPEDLTDNNLEIVYGIRLNEISRSRPDIRHHIAAKKNKEWLLANEELGWGVAFEPPMFTHRWDVTTDGEMICFRNNFVEHTFYEATLLTDEEREAIKSALEQATFQNEKRKKLLPVLRKLLIENMYPYSKIQTGELETKYGVHLNEIQRGTFMQIKHVPQDSSTKWMANNVLCWGSNTGWDVTRDGAIACCRVNYDDYINFEVIALTDAEIEAYKQQYAVTDNELVNRLATLQLMFEKALITEDEFNNKRSEILACV